MSIQGINRGSVTNVYKKHQAGNVVKKELANAKDQITLSQQGQLFGVAMQAIKDVDEIRESKVNEIRQRINSGQYQVSNFDVAEKLVAGAKFDVLG